MVSAAWVLQVDIACFLTPSCHQHTCCYHLVVGSGNAAGVVQESKRDDGRLILTAAAVVHLHHQHVSLCCCNWKCCWCGAGKQA